MATPGPPPRPAHRRNDVGAQSFERISDVPPQVSSGCSPIGPTTSTGSPFDRGVEPDVFDIRADKEPPAGRQTEIWKDAGAQSREMIDVHRTKEVGVVSQLVARPEVPARRACGGLMPESIERPHAPSEIVGNANRLAILNGHERDAESLACRTLGVRHAEAPRARSSRAISASDLRR